MPKMRHFIYTQTVFFSIFFWDILYGAHLKRVCKMFQCVPTINGPQKSFIGGLRTDRRRPACASAQSDQRLSYSLFGKYYI